MGALEMLNEESEPLGLRVCWVKTKILAFNDFQAFKEESGCIDVLLWRIPPYLT